MVEINGRAGVAEKIELRTVTLRDYGQTVHIFQNGKISTVSNLTKGVSAAVFNVGVAYKEDIDAVIKIMNELAAELREDEQYKRLIREDMEIAGLNKFGDSAVEILARIKTSPGNQWTILREYNRRLKIRFDAENIEISVSTSYHLLGRGSSFKVGSKSA